MKRRFFLTAIIVILSSILLLSGCSVIQNSISTVTVYGRITDYDTGAPLANADIVIDEVEYENATNYNGNYQIDNVRAFISLELNAHKEGYLIEEPVSVFGFSDGGSVRFDKELRNVEDYTGSISGQVAVISIQTAEAETAHQAQLNTISLQSGIDYVPGEILVKLKPGMTTQSLPEREKVLKEINTGEESIIKIKVPEGVSTEEFLNECRSRADVEAASLNHIAYLTGLPPDDPYYGQQWNLDRINMMGAWSVTTGDGYQDAEATVAVVDSGYIPDDYELTNLRPGWGYDFVDNDFDPYDSYAYTYNEDSHGTHISGIIGAVGDNGTGIAGISWGVKIIPVRVARGKQITEDNLISGIHYAVDQGFDIINLSLAFSDDNEYEHQFTEEALARAYNHGVTVVASAGNAGRNYVYYPASSYYTIAVGASNSSNQLASYSNYGEKLDIIAPGGESNYGIRSTTGYGEYGYMAGTSMAAPHVSGVAALLVSQGVEGPERIRETLRRTSTALNNIDLREVGLLNAGAALSSNTNINGIKVIATDKEYNQADYTYNILSDVNTVGQDGNYCIAHVKTGVPLTVIAWYDQDGDNQWDHWYEAYTEAEIGGNGVYPGEQVRDIDMLLDLNQ